MNAQERGDQRTRLTQLNNALKAAEQARAERDRLIACVQAVVACDANQEDWGNLEWLEEVQQAIDRCRTVLELIGVQCTPEGAQP